MGYYGLFFSQKFIANSEKIGRFICSYTHQLNFAMNDNHDYPLYNKADHTARVEDSFLTRREWLEKTGTGFGALALSLSLIHI